MNLADLLMMAALLSQTGGTTFQKASNLTEAPDA